LKQNTCKHFRCPRTSKAYDFTFTKKRTLRIYKFVNPLSPPRCFLFNSPIYQALLAGKAPSLHFIGILLRCLLNCHIDVTAYTYSALQCVALCHNRKFTAHTIKSSNFDFCTAQAYCSVLCNVTARCCRVVQCGAVWCSMVH